jgi:hypothetical protein
MYMSLGIKTERRDSHHVGVMKREIEEMENDEVFVDGI